MQSAAQAALGNLVKSWVDHEPRYGYDLSTLELTNEQVAIVIAAEPDAADDVANAVDDNTLLRLLRAWPGADASTIAIEIGAQTVVLAREGAQRYLLQLLIAESERREELARWPSERVQEPDKYMDVQS